MLAAKHGSWWLGDEHRTGEGRALPSGAPSADSTMYRVGGDELQLALLGGSKEVLEWVCGPLHKGPPACASCSPSSSSPRRLLRGCCPAVALVEVTNVEGIPPCITLCPKHAGKSLQVGDTDIPPPKPEESVEEVEEESVPCSIDVVTVSTAAATAASISFGKLVW